MKVYIIANMGYAIDNIKAMYNVACRCWVRVNAQIQFSSFSQKFTAFTLLSNPILVLSW